MTLIVPTSSFQLYHAKKKNAENSNPRNISRNKSKMAYHFFRMLSADSCHSAHFGNLESDFPIPPDLKNNPHRYRHADHDIPGRPETPSRSDQREVSLCGSA
jgi:hypothetical protein